MQTLKSLLLVPVIIIFAGCNNADSGETSDKQSENSDAGKGWHSLFDGQTLSGWQSAKTGKLPEQGWTVSDSTLILNADENAEAQGGDLITSEEFGDFILDWEWKMYTKGGNSGVKYFVKRDSAFEKFGPGLEYQILDDDNHPWMLEGKMKPGDFHTLGALYELYPAENRTVAPLGEWNHSRIVARGSHVEHWLNEVKVLEFERGSEDFRKRVAESKFAKHPQFGEPDKGYILLQDHGSKMAFRNIRIKTMD